MANNSGSIFAAVLGGALIGAVAALLLAPKTGKELRADVARIVREKAEHLNREEIEAVIDKVLARVRDNFSDDEITAAVDKVLAEQKQA